MKTDQLIPRIRGRVFETENKAWAFEVYVQIGPETPEGPMVLGSKITFLNRESALIGLKNATEDVLLIVCEAMGLPKPTQYMDLKNNVMVKL